jgi:hypothetical protein
MWLSQVTVGLYDCQSVPYKVFRMICECSVGDCWVSSLSASVLTLEVMLLAACCAAWERRSPFHTVPGELRMLSAVFSLHHMKAAILLSYDISMVPDVEVCWHRPDDVYALFYGFLPGQPPQSAGDRSPDQAAADAVAQQQPIGNPHQKIVLFADVRHLAAFATVQFGPGDADDAQLTSWAEAIAQELIAAVGDNCQRYMAQTSSNIVAGCSVTACAADVVLMLC